MALPELIVRKKNNTKPATPEGGLQPEELQQTGVETAIGFVPGVHTAEINQPHPNALRDRQEIAHANQAGVEDELTPQIPVGLYRQAFDALPAEELTSPDIQNTATEAPIAENNLESPGQPESTLSPEVFLAGIGKQPEAGPAQPESPQTTEMGTDKSPQHQSDNHHEIPIDLDHTHFPESQPVQTGPGASAASTETPEVKYEADSAELAAMMHNERQKLQEELLPGE